MRRIDYRERRKMTLLDIVEFQIDSFVATNTHTQHTHPDRNDQMDTRPVHSNQYMRMSALVMAMLDVML